MSREEEETYKKKEDSWDYDNDCLAEVDVEGDIVVEVILSAPLAPENIIPATPGGPGDPVYISSSPPERDTVIREAGRGVEGLRASRHAPVTEPEEAKEEEEKEIGVEEDMEMESGDAGGEGEIRMFPQKAKMAVDALAVFMKSTRMEGEDKKGPRRRLAKTEEVIWALGRSLDQEEKGIPRGWEEAEWGLEDEDREYLWEGEREWGSRRYKLIDKREGAMRQMSRKMEELSRQMAVLMANMRTATKEQVKVAKTHERKVKEQNQAAERQSQQARYIRDLDKMEKEIQAERERDEMRKAEALKTVTARHTEEEERKKRVVEAKVKAAKADLEVYSTRDEEEKKKKKELAEKARKEEEEEVKRLEASRRAKVPSEGRWWMVVKGKPMRKAMVIVLTKQPFNGLNPTIHQKWDKLIDNTNKLIATAEETAQNQLFRVNRMGVNSAVSKYERRIEIIQARPDIKDEEIP